MRVGIYDPYLDTLGGGESYILSIASYLSRENDVFLFWDDQSILKKAEERFNLDLSRVDTSANIFNGKLSFIKKILETKKYDLIIYLSDGSIPVLLAKKNYLIFHFPVNWINGKDLITKLKFKKINKVICYSQFVKNYLDKTFNTDAEVLAPAINLVNVAKEGKKENIILSVGRFTKAINSKKQEVMLDVFKQLVKDELKGWKLVLIGSRLEKDKDFVEDLRVKAKGYPVEVLDNVSFDELMEYYKKAKVYWHAAGFGEDLEKHPEKAEHFGISTVEAMALGAVPVVIDAGGQPEIVEENKSGFLWSDTKDLINKTKRLVENKNLWEEMSKAAIARSKNYSTDIFNKKLESIIK